MHDQRNALRRGQPVQYDAEGIADRFSEHHGGRSVGFERDTDVVRGFHGDGDAGLEAVEAQARRDRREPGGDVVDVLVGARPPQPRLLDDVLRFSLIGLEKVNISSTLYSSTLIFLLLYLHLFQDLLTQK